jgi:DNA-binding transcriptional MerR regulator
LDQGSTRPGLRIGELSKRVGVSAHVLRAWESRYGLLRPARSPGGFRLYTAGDENRVRTMQAHLAAGLSAAEAAAAALAEPAADQRRTAVADASLVELRTGLAAALDSCDEPAAHEVFDRLLAAYTVETVLHDVVLPFLHELGERWAAGSVDVAGEHFASQLIRGRLSGLARGWGASRGPTAVLACPSGELHDLPLLAFGIALNRQGWAVSYLGPDTPVSDLIAHVRRTRPELVVLAATDPEHFARTEDDLAAIGRLAPLALAGAGATAGLADSAGARLLTADPVNAAADVAPGIALHSPSGSSAD